MVEDVWPGFRHALDRAFLVTEVGGENLDGGARRFLAHGLDHPYEMLRATVVQVVAVHGRDDHVPQIHLGHRFRHVARLIGVQTIGHAGLDVAEPARPRAGVAP